MSSRYSIGIDLGTTNCALAYVALGEEGAVSQVLPIEQREELNTLVSRSTLPSFLVRVAGEAGPARWELGLFARNRFYDSPRLVAHSAKSWLCQHAVRPDAKILPWKSPIVPDAEKLSPLEASSRLLAFLKDAWEGRFGSDAPFDEQQITITVPASFDVASQAATLEAAKLAGFAEGTRLLEEPQAAFYRHLESVGEGGSVLGEGECVLVVDVGGGTSDFSLFRVGELSSETGRRQIERVAVSEHLLLGGDNIDLALAHALETELSPNGEELSSDQWSYLISRARDLKERCFSSQDSDDESLTVSLPSRGSGLFAGSLTTVVSASDVRKLLLEGFYPLCSADSRADRSSSGLLEWGLPYAADCAVTRHLAEFLQGRPRVDQVLFNGGSLMAPVVRKRLLESFARWYDGAAPRELGNAERDLAVARGAASYGALLAKGRRRISARTPRAVYLEIGSSTDQERSLLCVLPKGTAVGASVEVELQGLRLRTNRRASFSAFQGAERKEDSSGAVVRYEKGGFHSLPVLQAKIEAPEAPDEQWVAVSLRSQVNELGVLTISCESKEESCPGGWPLSFNLRSEADRSEPAPAMGPEILSVSDRIEKGIRALEGKLKQGRGGAIKASQVYKEVERALGAPKHEWNLPTARRLFAVLEDADGLGHRSEAYLETWLQLAGYLLRPGFGFAEDEQRVLRLSRWGSESAVSSARVEVQRLIMLRRVVAGLEEAEQSRVFDTELAALRSSPRASAERIRLLGCLEKVDLERKQLLFRDLEQRLREALAEDQHVEAVLGGLGPLLSRAPFRAGPDRVMPPKRVEELYDLLKRFDWQDSRFAQALPLFLSAARKVDERALDLSKGASRKIVSKLEKSGVGPGRLQALREYVPISRGDQAASFGEALPVGLVLD
ncbi:Hsp70 family protein [Pelagicoccus sp. SDUM812003]|uniref:hsp70 family protein n=1 Tax=Pelagicoccus sp. SDUM812003 TaxID=3041267 RepID=UPI00280CE9DC|nr:Hsp70 family protein [Pelagicoccus sp. SDUM812003]MDQ8204856.1 Hsp70 family protein [Pelagicoccus sp. SDUM812003]